MTMIMPSRATRKQKRAALILAGLALLGIAAGLVLYALSDTIVFFYTPSELAQKNVQPGQRFRLGGLVETGSIVKGEGMTVRFVVTEGKLDGSGNFVADTVLAKHDETYMPKDVADRLKQMGVWQEGKGTSP